jgi:hypothetical protein
MRALVQLSCLLCCTSLLITACSSDDVDGEEIIHHQPSLDLVAATSSLRPAELPILEIAIQEPAFAGYHCEDGDLVVRLTDQNAADAVLALVSDELASLCYTRARQDHSPTVRTAAALFPIHELFAWRDAIADDFFALDGAVSLGIDYARNRLELTVRSTVTSAATNLLDSLDVAAEAYTIFTSDEEIVRESHIDLYHSTFPSPIPAGPMHNFTPGGCSGMQCCTIGPAVRRWMGTYWQTGWVVNSHCTQNFWQMDSTHIDHTGNVIGVEFLDPPGWTCGFWNNRTCRRSDAAWVYAYPATAQRGKITRTTSWQGSRIVDDLRPRFGVVGTRNAVQNMELEKVGMRTGWTYGQVSNTCKDISYDDPVNGKIRLYCQGVATYSSDFGDSGAPTFFWLWNGNWEVNEVELVGVHWGAKGSERYYSPWGQITTDLGSLDPIQP